jgi:endoglycosylceramidase
MHQDLYSVLYSDGAPEWATLHEDQPHVTGEIWSESYFISPAVQTAFDNFWKNTPAPDGTGIQDHFINAWRHVAERFADQAHIIGYDLMNEPFMGSGAAQIMPAMLQAYAELLVSEGQEPPPTMEELAQMWSSEAERNKVYEKLSDPEKFSVIADAMYSIQAPFEKDMLMPFYQKCRDAIREVDPHHIIFIEHAIFANSGALTAIQPLFNEKGERDPLVAYAPHGYDLVTDTENQAASSLERVRFIFDRIKQNADRLDMPVLVGEWGAFYSAGDPAVVEQAKFILDQYKKHGFSHTYWSYFEGLEKMPYFKALQNR